MSNPTKPINLDFLGRCYDLVSIDPVNLTVTKQHNALVFSDDNFHTTFDDQHLIPNGVFFTEHNRGQLSTRSQTIVTAFDYMREVSGSVGLSVGVPGFGSFSASTSFTQMVQTKQEAQRANEYTRSEIELYELSVQFFESGGDSQDLKVDPDLVSAIQALPLPKHAEDRSVEQAYQQFIRNFGTHFATRVVFGGRAFQSVSMSSDAYTQLMNSEVNVSVGAEGVFKAISAGGSVDGSDRTQRQYYEAIDRRSIDITWLGGTVNTDLDAWAASLDQKPVPVQVSLTPIYDLVTADLLPNLDEVEARQEALRQAITLHLNSANTSHYRYSNFDFATGQVVAFTGYGGWPYVDPFNRTLRGVPIRELELNAKKRYSTCNYIVHVVDEHVIALQSQVTKLWVAGAGPSGRTVAEVPDIDYTDPRTHYEVIDIPDGRIALRGPSGLIVSGRGETPADATTKTLEERNDVLDFTCLFRVV